MTWFAGCKRNRPTTAGSISSSRAVRASIQPQLDLLRSRRFFESPGEPSPHVKPKRPISSDAALFHAVATPGQGAALDEPVAT